MCAGQQQSIDVGDKSRAVVAVLGKQRPNKRSTGRKANQTAVEITPRIAYNERALGPYVSTTAVLGADLFTQQ